MNGSSAGIDNAIWGVIRHWLGSVKNAPFWFAAFFHRLDIKRTAERAENAEDFIREARGLAYEDQF